MFKALILFVSGRMISKIVAGVIAVYYFFFGWLLPFVCAYDLQKDVSYDKVKTAVMDVYLPENADEQDAAGCVIMLHGGSAADGDKKDERARCHSLARRGYVVASINYTLYSKGSNYSLDIVFAEITKAISTLCDMAAERGITLTAAATAGYSEGGLIAMLYAYTHADESPLPIVFTASMAGPAEYSYELWGDSAYRMAARLTGVTITSAMVESGEADALAASISPASCVATGGVPTVMAYGKKDTTVPIENANALAAALTEAEIPFTDIRFSRSDHDMMGNPFKRMKYNRTLARYCKDYFGY